MKWIITTSTEEYVDYTGVVHEARMETFECPFECGQEVYYAKRKDHLFRKPEWVVVKTRVYSVWATRYFGVRIEYDDELIPDSLFDRLFADRDAAIEFCLKKNQQSKVKIYNDK